MSDVVETGTAENTTEGVEPVGTLLTEDPDVGTETSQPNPDEGTETHWYDDIPEEHRTEKLLRFKDQGELARSYNEAQALISKKGLAPPGEDATEEEVDAWYRSIGRPDAATDYVFQAPEGFFENESAMNLARDAAFRVGLTPGQFQAMVEAHLAVHEAGQAQSRSQVQAEVEQARAALQKEWGTETEENIAKANFVAKKLGLLEAINSSPLGRNAEVIKSLASQFGAFAESPVAGGRPAGRSEEDIRSDIHAIWNSPDWSAHGSSQRYAAEARVQALQQELFAAQRRG